MGIVSVATLVGVAAAAQWPNGIRNAKYKFGPPHTVDGYECYTGTLYDRAHCCETLGNGKSKCEFFNMVWSVGGDPGRCFNAEYTMDACCFPMPLGNPECWLGHMNFNRCCRHNLYPLYNQSDINEVTHYAGFKMGRYLQHADYITKQKAFDRFYDKVHPSGCELDFEACLAMAHPPKDIELLSTALLETRAALARKNELITDDGVKRQHLYVEWGTGCSANWYPYLAERTLLIESSVGWGRTVANYSVPACLHKQGYLDGILVTDGSQTDQSKEEKYRNFFPQPPGGEWSWQPVRGTTGHAYVNSIDQLNIPGKKIDVALVDGLWRIACALKLLQYDVEWMLIHDWSDPDKWMTGHDFRAVLFYYDHVNWEDFEIRSKKHGIVDDFTRVQEEIEPFGLALFKRKAEHLMPADWETAYERYLITELSGVPWAEVM